MKIYLKIFFASLTLIFAASCDYIDNPIEEDSTGGNNGGDGDTLLRDVLIMDFTGHSCSNCPNATVTAEAIYEDYPEQVFVLGVHPDLNGLSQPQDGEPGEPFTTDFRTELGIHLQNQFSVGFLPFGVISGLEIDGSYYQPVGNWRSSTEELLDDPKIAEIEIALNYDSTSRVLDISTITTAVEEWNGIFNLSVILVEDSVIDWQKNGTGEGNPSDPSYPGGNIPNYYHRHVLRGAVNGTQGTGLVLDDEITAPETEFENGYSTDIDENFDHQHMYVYAYVYNADTYEIIDVSSKKILE